MDEKTTKQIGITVVAGLIVYALWDGWLKKYWFDFLDDGTLNHSADGTGGSGSNWGTGAPGSGSGSGGGSGSGSGSGGAGGSGAGSGSGSGSGGAGGAGAGADYAALAAAIEALAAGVRLPNIQSVVKEVSSGTTELVPAIGGKRVCVLAYAITAAGTVAGAWKDGNASSDVWRMELDTSAGNSGANLSTAWPGYLFATSGGNALNVETTGAAAVCVTYWQENA